MASEFQTRVALVVCPSLSGIPPVVTSVFAMSGEWGMVCDVLMGAFFSEDESLGVAILWAPLCNDPARRKPTLVSPGGN